MLLALFHPTLPIPLKSAGLQRDDWVTVRPANHRRPRLGPTPRPRPTACRWLPERDRCEEVGSKWAGARGVEAAQYARAVAQCALSTVRLVSASRPSATAGTDLCLEPIPAHGVCREFLASPLAPSWSHLPERKSACGSGRGGTCSEEWRCRVRRCAGLDSGVPRPTCLGEWAVARGRLVLAIRGPARRGPLPLRGRGMSSGSFGVLRLTGGWPAVGTAGEWRRGWRWVRRGLRVPPRLSWGPQQRRTRGLASPIHLTRAGFRARWPKSELLAKSSFFGP